MPTVTRRRRLILLLAVLVAVPVLLLGAVGARLARREREAVRQSVDALLTGQLEAYRDRLVRELAQLERELGVSLERLAGADGAALREATRRDPRALQYFRLDAAQELIFPAGSTTGFEKDFLERTGAIWKDRDLLVQVPQDEITRRPSKKSSSSSPVPRDRGWYVWYWGTGLRFLYYLRHTDGSVTGLEIDRSRLLSELISAFPGIPGESGEKRIRLVDPRGAALHVWGSYTPPERAVPAVRLPLAPPLHAWSLEYFAPPAALAAGGSALDILPLWTSLGAVSLVLVFVAVALFREYGREAREAEQRVTFVNRVSHELKTPLTSIRMYAELLEEALADEEGPARRHAGILVSESQRLSRLIGNVLTFAKKDKGKLGLHAAPVVIDQIVDKVLAQFAPSLASRNIAVEVDRGAPARVRADSDLAIQVLANLITNVEKYAAAGGVLRVRTRQEAGSTRITVSDRGPGIRPELHEKVFEPFHRGEAADRLDEESAGTGIGLSIVRELARLHGGNAWIEPSAEGTVFHVTLETPSAEEIG